jgi:hypothetical protein
MYVVVVKSLFAQESQRTVTENVTETNFYAMGYVTQNTFNMCELPTISRGGGDSNVRHNLQVQVEGKGLLKNTEDLFMTTAESLDYDLCTGHKKNILKQIATQNSPLAINLFYTDHKMTTCDETPSGTRGCSTNCYRIISGKILNLDYVYRVQLPQELCQNSGSTFEH